MKKRVMTAALALLSLSSYAQFYAGGTLGIATQTLKYDGESYTNSGYSISPELGYNINKTWAVGACLTAQYTVSGGGDSDQTLVALSPYLRATFAQVGCVKFFTEGAFMYAYAKESDFDGESGWGVSLRPGILIALSEKFHLLGRTTLLEYSAVGSGDDKVSGTGFSINSGLEIGAIFNF